jgi:GH15 family glucan-1,4-alpha-glucosidase
MWPRDASLTANALDMAGYSGLSRNFFNFCNKIIEKEGYFFHKYTPSGSVASSWHPWLKDGKPQLPIQEDETALVLWALWEHYKNFRDIEMIKPLYKSLIKPAADFLMNYRDLRTGLPLPSYDLWEEKHGVFTFTCAAVYGGLMAASNFTLAFGEEDLSNGYKEGALRLRSSMDKYLYLEKEKRFARMVQFKKDGSYELDSTLDASLYGTFAFGAYSPFDEKVLSTMKQIKEKLWCKTPVGGLIRYENDSYYRVSNKANPWFVTTLWLAQHLIEISKKKEDLKEALKILEWVADHALKSGVLAEQVNPDTNEPLSISPLTWAHGSFVGAVQKYLNKLLELEKCPDCGQSKFSKFR